MPFLCCHEQIKKHLEAPSRCFWPSNPSVWETKFRPALNCEKEIILCINVSRYLPKEKEETNFLYEESMISAKQARREQEIKEEINPRCHEGTCWPCDLDGNGQ